MGGGGYGERDNEKKQSVNKKETMFLYGGRESQGGGRGHTGRKRGEKENSLVIKLKAILLSSELRL